MRSFDPEAMARRQIDNITGVQEKVGKPIILVLGTPGNAGGFTSYQAMLDLATEAGLAVFPTMRRAALALSRLLRWQTLREDL